MRYDSYHIKIDRDGIVMHIVCYTYDDGIKDAAAHNSMLKAVLYHNLHQENLVTLINVLDDTKISVIGRDS